MKRDIMASGLPVIGRVVRPVMIKRELLEKYHVTSLVW
jgi:hypothetical protein